MATRSVIVLATVVSIRDKFCYPCCTRCHKKVHSREDEMIFWCEGCREKYNAESVQYRYRISVMASDRTQLAQVTVFGSCLDRFFGTPATSFIRFVTSLSSVPSTIPWSRVVHQAMEQCFVGTLLQFGFRIYSPQGRTASQASRNSPFHLNNIVSKMPRPEKTSCQPEQFPSLLACQILPSSDQCHTVIQILNEYLQELHRSTPHSFCLKTSQSSPLLDFQSQASSEVPRCTSIQKRASSIYCTPHEFGSMNTPLVLTGSSQSPSGSVPTQASVLASDSKERRKLYCPHSGYGNSSFSNNKSNSGNRNSSDKNQPVTPGILKSRKLNTNPTKDLRDFHLSDVWEEYDEFPSSEDLSAFLADLEKDALNREDGQSLHTLHSKKHNSPLPSLAPNAMTTEVVTSLKEVVREMRMPDSSNTEDYTEFSDFRSSEDLDAFLADMELDYESMLMQKPLTPKTSVESTAQDDARPPSKMDYSLYSDRNAYGSDCSDSQFLRDCETVFTEITENICDENHKAESKFISHLSKSLVLNGSQRSVPQPELRREDINNEISTQFKPCCQSGTIEEFHKKDIVCNTPLSYQHKDTIPPRDCNTLNGQRENQTNSNKAPLLRKAIEHLGNGEVSMLSGSCNMLSTASTSPDLFSRSLCSAEGCSRTPVLFSSPRLQDVKSRPRCTHHSMTPELFSSSGRIGDCTNSGSKYELNSMPLFSSSDSSYLSSVSSPLPRTDQRPSCPSPDHFAVAGNEAASLPNVGHPNVGKEFDRNSLAASFHSTPYSGCIRSKMSREAWTPIQVSPLFSNSGSQPCNDISFQGTPVLFSQISNSSF